MTGRGLRGRLAATATGAGLGAFMVAGAIGPLRAALERVRAARAGRGTEPGGPAQGRLRPALPWPHRRGPGPAHARHRRPRPGLRLDREDARPGRGLPGAGRPEEVRARAASGRRPRSSATAWSSACRPTPASRSNRSPTDLSHRGTTDADTDAIPAARARARGVDTGHVVLAVRDAAAGIQARRHRPAGGGAPGHVRAPAAASTRVPSPTTTTTCTSSRRSSTR